MLKEDAIIKTQKRRGYSYALDLRGARRILEPLHYIYKNAATPNGVCIAIARSGRNTVLGIPRFLNLTIPNQFPTRLQSSAK